MQVNQPGSAKAFPANQIAQAKKAEGSATSAQHGEINQMSAEQESHLAQAIQDLSVMQPMPNGKAPLSIQLLQKEGPQSIIEDTLDSALLTKMPFARQAAMRNLLGETKGMTPGQLDDLKDAIVKRMSSPDTTQNERDVLKNMYDVVDAVSENRPIPPHLIAPIVHPHKQPFPAPPIQIQEPPYFPYPKQGGGGITDRSKMADDLRNFPGIEKFRMESQD